MYVFLLFLNLFYTFIICSTVFSKTSAFKPDDNVIIFALSHETAFNFAAFLFLKLFIITSVYYFIFKFSLKEKKTNDFKYSNLLNLTELMTSKKIDLSFKYTNHCFLAVIAFIYALILFKPDNYVVSLSLMLGALIGIYLYVTKHNVDYNEKALKIILKELNKVSKKENAYGQEYLSMPIGIIPKKTLEFFASEKFTYELSGVTRKQFNELKHYALIKLVLENNQKPSQEFKIFKY